MQIDILPSKWFSW